jgi:hypothetical protein
VITRSSCWSDGTGIISCNLISMNFGTEEERHMLSPTLASIQDWAKSTLHSVQCSCFHLLEIHSYLKANFRFPFSFPWELQPAFITQLSNLFYLLNCIKVLG